MTAAEHKPHMGDAVEVGAHTIYLGGTDYIEAGFDPVAGFDVVVPLAEEWLSTFTGLQAQFELVNQLVLEDFAGVPDDWSERLDAFLLPHLSAGKKVVIFCKGGHGRTGTVLSSLIARLEPSIDDPILAARERYCQYCVETQSQAEAIFALKKQNLPDFYFGTFLF